ncbi:MAG: (d)CMP kinase [Lachnospiraceae bacterium]|nr:(d)CMP kinase [Lachnospiraceae bacterium]
MSYSVAIDGPAGAGKSTIARQLARETGFIYVDTGAMYRAMALYFLRQGIEPPEADRIAGACKEADVTIVYEEGTQQVLLNGENVTGLLRTEEVGNMASASSVYPEVRMKLVELQRKLARASDVIMDGRDIGTYVLPGADVKVYLTASSACRAKRRYEELQEKGALGSMTLEEIKADIEERDYRDMHREFAPLRQAEDAVLVDSSDMTIQQVMERIRSLIRP